MCTAQGLSELVCNVLREQCRDEPSSLCAPRGHQPSAGSFLSLSSEAIEPRLYHSPFELTGATAASILAAFRHAYMWKQLHLLQIEAGFCETQLSTEDAKYPLLPWWVLSEGSACKYRPCLLTEMCYCTIAFTVKSDIHTELQTPQHFVELVFINPQWTK